MTAERGVVQRMIPSFSFDASDASIGVFPAPVTARIRCRYGLGIPRFNCVIVELPVNRFFDGSYFRMASQACATPFRWNDINSVVDAAAILIPLKGIR
jgi:hypothetical protein